ncbi:DUF4956 domain-containing protein [Parabacteroides sp. FAFU027]|uniref:DUF4956 domain-containing protein n=1 Tax=Parabacteroides sp. FAFU027 TaxID=2922715 RepID=UPI001FAED86A|nr:DUF4956 domain-containing protein [Parabacteroides sp. FAFU027]
MFLAEKFPDFDPSIAQQYGEGYSNITGMELFGNPFFDSNAFWMLTIRFGFNLLVSAILIHCLYFRKGKRRDYYFTLFMFSITMFLLIYLMDNVKIQIGLTLGLFAIFGVIKYRTESVPIREMTYLFIIIGVSVINGLATSVSYMELIATNLFFILAVWALESTKFLKITPSKLILYDKIHLITVDKREEMIADIAKRTGLKVLSVEIGHIDFLRDIAFVKVHYDLNGEEPCTIENITKLGEYNG